MKKLATMAGFAALSLALVLPSMAEEGLVKVGGHLKGPMLADYVSGKAMVDGVKSEGSYSAGSYFTTHAFILYVSKDITDNVSVSAAPDFGNAGAGATPSLGKKLGETLKTTSGSISMKFNELVVKYNLIDYGVQLRAGYMILPFDQDYGKELFWGDQFAGGKFTLAQSWHDTGLEIYKPFELGSVSLPTWLAIVNGNKSSDRDNNNSRAFMLHVEPQFGGIKTFASYGGGKWGSAVVSSTAAVLATSTEANDNGKTFHRWTAGAEYVMGAFKLRGEVGGSKYEDQLLLTSAANARRDFEDFGFYGKLFYTIKPDKLTALLHYDKYVKDVVNGNNNGVIEETYDTTYVGLNYDLAPAATLMLGYTYGDWSNNDIAAKKDYVKFNRLNAAIRVTF